MSVCNLLSLLVAQFRLFWEHWKMLYLGLFSCWSWKACRSGSMGVGSLSKALQQREQAKTPCPLVSRCAREGIRASPVGCGCCWGCGTAVAVTGRIPDPSQAGQTGDHHLALLCAVCWRFGKAQGECVCLRWQGYKMSFVLVCQKHWFVYWVCMSVCE